MTRTVSYYTRDEMIAWVKYYQSVGRQYYERGKPSSYEYGRARFFLIALIDGVSIRKYTV